MKKLLLALTVVAAAMGANAADNYLHIKTATGWQVLDLDKVDRLTFKGGTMTVTDADNKPVTSFKQSELATIYVDEFMDLSAVGEVAAEPTLTYCADSRTATVAADGAFEVFALSGERLVCIPYVKKGETVTLTGLGAGVVILKSGNYSIKAVIK